MPDLNAVIAESLKLPADRVTDELSMMNCPEWDSLAHVDLMMGLERAYGVVVDQDAMLDLTDVGAIRRFVDRHAGGSPAGGSHAASA